MTTHPTATSDVLDAAAELIEHEGLSKGLYVNSAGCICAAGAIQKVVHGDAENERPHPLGDAAKVALVAVIGSGSRPPWPVTHREELIGYWNDRSTEAEVVAKLREAAAQIRAGAR